MRAVFVLVCLPLSGLAGWYFYAARRSQMLVDVAMRWPTVPGEVIESSVGFPPYEMLRVLVEIATPASGPFDPYRPYVRYEYMVEGVRHEGEVIRFGTSDMSKTEAEKMIGPYPAGTAVTVHYNPSDPQMATLETIGEATHNQRTIAIFYLYLAVVVFIACVLLFPKESSLVQ